MAVKIRLTRVGKRGQSLYRVVAIDEHKKSGGSAIEIIGHYNPADPDNRVKIKIDRLDYWLSVGAQPSATVKHLLKI